MSMGFDPTCQLGGNTRLIDPTGRPWTLTELETSGEADGFECLALDTGTGESTTTRLLTLTRTPAPTDPVRVRWSNNTHTTCSPQARLSFITPIEGRDFHVWGLAGKAWGGLRPHAICARRESAFTTRQPTPILAAGAVRSGWDDAGAYLVRTETGNVFALPEGQDLNYDDGVWAVCVADSTLRHGKAD